MTTALRLPAWPQSRYERKRSGLYVPRRRPLPRIAGAAGAWVRDLGTAAVSGGAGATSFTVTTTHAIAAGDTGVMAIFIDSAPSTASAFTVSDGTHSWNIDGTGAGSTSKYTLTFASYYYAAGLSTGATLTISFTSASSYYYASVSEFSGLLTASWFDLTKYGVDQTATTSPTTGASGTLATASELIYAAFCFLETTGDVITMTPGGGFTALTTAQASDGSNEAGLLVAWKDVAATTAVTFNPTASESLDRAYAGLVAYKTAIATSFPPVPAGLADPIQPRPLASM